MKIELPFSCQNIKSFKSRSIHLFDILLLFHLVIHIWPASEKHESTLLHTDVLNEFLTADHSCKTFFFEKTLNELGSSHLYASFSTFCVQIGQLFEAQWELKIDVILLRKRRFYRFQTFFKDSLCFEYLTNLYAKGAKISVKMWANKFFQKFFKNILLHINGWLSKIRSVHAYGAR